MTTGTSFPVEQSHPKHFVLSSAVVFSFVQWCCWRRWKYEFQSSQCSCQSQQRVGHFLQLHGSNRKSYGLWIHHTQRLSCVFWREGKCDVDRSNFGHNKVLIRIETDWHLIFTAILLISILQLQENCDTMGQIRCHCGKTTLCLQHTQYLENRS